MDGEAETPYYYHFDGLGSVIALSDGDANIVETYCYTAFGVTTIKDANGAGLSESSVGNPYMFTGRRLDNETGLYYYRARHYDPETGRFLQTDPLGYVDGMNLYAYCGNNPVNWVDPWGLLTMYYWEPTANRKGHISIQLENGKYISFWPYGKPKGRKQISTEIGLEFDKQWEGDDEHRDENGNWYRNPTKSTKISDLDEEAIEEWWDNYNGNFSGWFNNCSDIVRDALMKGGKDMPWNIINTPKNVFQDATRTANEPYQDFL